jgi:uncharacterized membrane protein YhaH (DUF805 family)
MNWYIDALKNYANFQGRAQRKAYWMFVLFWFIAAGIAAILDNVLGTNGAIFGLYALGTLVPFIALAVRRLHDIGKSGWWYLIQLVPVIGGIWFLVLTVTDSQTGSNQYGPNPKGA